MLGGLNRTTFWIALVYLGVCAIALEGATSFLQLHFRKQAVELRQPLLEGIGKQLGPWVQVSDDQPLPEEMEHALGTTKYVQRYYIDSRVINAATIAAVKDEPSDDRRGALLGALQKETPEAVMTILVTYYTGMVDTVSHVPDRCYVADGYSSSGASVVQWSAGGRNLSARYLTFEDSSGQGRINRNVGYLFNVNGQYVDDSLNVRWILSDLRARYGYYAKIEMMNTMRDSEKAAKLMDDFLGSALGDIEQCLPDWTQYKGK